MQQGKRSAGILLVAAALMFTSACAPPFKARIDNLASAKAPARLKGLIALRNLLETGGVREKSDRIELMRRVFRMAGDSEEYPQNVMLALNLAGRYGGVASVPVLAGRAVHTAEYWPLRQEAARWLGKYPTLESHSALIRVLERDTEPIVRQEAARSLGECGNENCLSALVTAAAGNPDESVRYTACRALGKLTGLDFGVNEARWEKWWAEKRREKK